MVARLRAARVTSHGRGEPLERFDHALDEHLRLGDGDRIEAEPDVESIVDTEPGDVHQRTEPGTEREALLDDRPTDVANTADTRQGRGDEVDRADL